MTDAPSPRVVIGDLHGHLDLFERLLERIDQKVPEAHIVTLGDYVDNGPQIPELLDRLIALQEARPGRFWPILGNHDLALLRALGWPHAEPGPIAPQRDALTARTLPAEPTFMPAPLRDKRLALEHDPTWQRIVVSSHTHLPGQPFFSAPRRVCVSATADHGGGLIAVLLPERRGWWTDGRAVTAVG